MKYEKFITSFSCSLVSFVNGTLENKQCQKKLQKNYFKNAIFQTQNLLFFLVYKRMKKKWKFITMYVVFLLFVMLQCNELEFLGVWGGYWVEE
jgi:hypothetical protein